MSQSKRAKALLEHYRRLSAACDEVGGGIATNPWIDYVSEMTIACCDLWAIACAEGTDNEGYGSLVYPDGENGDLYIGKDLPRVNFCPWCGKKR